MSRAGRALAGVGRRVVDNATIKLLSFGLALVLFLLVRGDKEAVVGVSVPVVFSPDPQRVLVSEPVERLKVTVRGRWSKLRAVTAEDLEPVRVDLTDETDGEYFFADQSITLPAGVRVVALRPPSAQLRFEPRVHREVAVEPVLVGAHDETYIMTDKKVEPGQVRVSGARSQVQALDRVRTVPIDVSRRWESTVLEVGLAPPGKLVEVDPPVPRVRVRLQNEARVGERTLKGEPVKVVGATRYTTAVKPATVALRMEGPLKQFRTLQPEDVLAYVDVEDLDARPPGTYRRRLKVDNLPPGVELLRSRPKVFHVTTKPAPRPPEEPKDEPAPADGAPEDKPPDEPEAAPEKDEAPEETP